ncbi:Leucine-rich repeat receptor protein kinase EMS1 [Camellia lanceoleosa]|uniref:Leucine-rich repeat receptor protein kinase EMS1 n=1 Tax=Camellia lanceoleosa TaxID=1840588 RepID=A0ACC0FKJ6_9ERIC|nr:Leucine-rich repeat receptor protein kinase EMS1 [Camellia lanceoleosa]
MVWRFLLPWGGQRTMVVALPEETTSAMRNRIKTAMVVSTCGRSHAIGGWNWRSMRQDLYLDYTSINQSFLHNIGVMSSLRVLTLRGIGLNGSLPNKGWCELSNLQELDLSDNGFKGMLPSCFGDLTSTRLLDLSSNQFTRNLALSPLTNLTTLEYLFLSYNHFEIQPSFISFFNHSKHKIPEHLVIGCSLLSFLQLSNNNLYDQISPLFVNSSLEYLYLDNNHFVGKIPDIMSLPPSLVVIGISNNHLSRELPKWMGNMTGLNGINMFSNHFEGPIPIELCKLGQLEFLDLLENNLSGYIPSCFNSSSMMIHVHLNQNKLRGPMTFSLFNSSSLVTLGVSDNNLSGTISSWIGTLSTLSILVLKFNNFEGEILVQLCQLKQLTILDLSQNNFSGLIPHCFIDIPFETTYTKSSVI